MNCGSHATQPPLFGFLILALQPSFFSIHAYLCASLITIMCVFFLCHLAVPNQPICFIILLLPTAFLYNFLYTLLQCRPFLFVCLPFPYPMRHTHFHTGREELPCLSLYSYFLFSSMPMPARGSGGQGRNRQEDGGTGQTGRQGGQMGEHRPGQWKNRQPCIPASSNCPCCLSPTY